MPQHLTEIEKKPPIVRISHLSNDAYCASSYPTACIRPYLQYAHLRAREQDRSVQVGRVQTSFTREETELDGIVARTRSSKRQGLWQHSASESTRSGDDGNAKALRQQLRGVALVISCARDLERIIQWFGSRSSSELRTSRWHQRQVELGRSSSLFSSLPGLAASFSCFEYLRVWVV